MLRAQAPSTDKAELLKAYRHHALITNAAWLAFAVMAFNISRVAAVAAGTGTASMTTVLRQIIATPARLATTGRRMVMGLPPLAMADGVDEPAGNRRRTAASSNELTTQHTTGATGERK